MNILGEFIEKQHIRNDMITRVIHINKIQIEYDLIKFLSGDNFRESLFDISYRQLQTQLYSQLKIQLTS